MPRVTTLPGTKVLNLRRRSHYFRDIAAAGLMDQITSDRAETLRPPWTTVHFREVSEMALICCRLKIGKNENGKLQHTEMFGKAGVI